MSEWKEPLMEPAPDMIEPPTESDIEPEEDEPLEDPENPEDEEDILNDEDDEPDDEDLPLVDATENRR
jgi:hypothetical protein